MKNERFITVLTVTYEYEIAAIRGKLESEGIVCFVKDEFTVQVNPFYSNAVGGIKLQVRESDLSQAIEIMEEAGYIESGSFKAPDEPCRLNDTLQELRNANSGAEVFCPVCGSDEVTKSRKVGGWFFLITSLLFTYPAPFFRRKYYCFDCRQEFKREKRQDSQ